MTKTWLLHVTHESYLHFQLYKKANENIPKRKKPTWGQLNDQAEKLILFFGNLLSRDFLRKKGEFLTIDIWGNRTPARQKDPRNDEDF